VSEISRTDHVTVDNAVLDSPRTYLPRRPRSQRGAYEESKQVRGVNHEPPGPHCSTRHQRKGGVVPREGRSRKGRGMGGELMRLNVERGNPSGVQPGVECLASARYESWLHHSRRRIYPCSPSSGSRWLVHSGQRALGRWVTRIALSWPGRVSGNTLARRRSRAAVRR
jgi:hypothetical protein